MMKHNVDDQNLVFANEVFFTLRDGRKPPVTWLREFLHPWLSAVSDRGGIVVALSNDPEMYAASMVRKPIQTQSAHCFSLDTSAINLPVWINGGRMEIHDFERSCFITLDDSGITVVGSPDSDRWRFTVVLLVLELIAVSLRQSCVDMHAAAVALHDQGLMLVGPKRAGKTTLAIYLLSTGLYRTVANDRCYVKRSDDVWQLHGVPTPVKIRKETLEIFPNLLAEFSSVDRAYLYSHQELEAHKVASLKPTVGDVAMSPPQFMRQLRIQASPSPRLSTLVFPYISSDVQSMELSQLTPAQVRRQLEINRYGAVCRNNIPGVFDRYSNKSPVDNAALLDQLAATVSGYRLALGPDAYASDQLAHELAELIGIGK